MLTLIDGDIIVYRAALACEELTYSIVDGDATIVAKDIQYKKEAHEWLSDKDYPDTYTIIPIQRATQPPAVACKYAGDTIKRLLLLMRADDYHLYISGGGKTFRHRFYPNYKAGRNRVPIYKEEVKRHLVNTWLGEKAPSNYEVDDILGIEQSGGDLGDTIICSIDKDLKMIPGNHSHLVTGERTYISEQSGMFNFLKQVLTGDRVDNIKGLSGIGDVKALKLLKDQRMQSDPYSFIKGIYLDHGLMEEDLNQTARLIWILRSFNDCNLKSFKDIIDTYYQGEINIAS